LPFRRDTLQLQRAYQEMYEEDLRDRIEEELEDADELAYALDLMETPFERYLNEASGWLRRSPAIGFGQPWTGKGWYDERYWTQFYDRDHDETKLILRSGRLPHQAIDALFHEQDRWHADCTVFIEVVQLYALRQSLGAKRFDARVGGKMELRMHRSSGVKSQVLYKRESPTERFKVTGEEAPATVGPADEVLAEAPIGSRVRWTTQLLFDRANNAMGRDVFLGGTGQLTWLPYIHENAMKLAPDRFAAQGVGGGGRVSREKIEDTLADVTADVYPDKPRPRSAPASTSPRSRCSSAPTRRSRSSPAPKTARRGRGHELAAGCVSRRGRDAACGPGPEPAAAERRARGRGMGGQRAGRRRCGAPARRARPAACRGRCPRRRTRSGVVGRRRAAGGGAGRFRIALRRRLQPGAPACRCAGRRGGRGLRRTRLDRRLRHRVRRRPLAPSRPQGRALLAHELAHVAQLQRPGATAAERATVWRAPEDEMPADAPADKLGIAVSVTATELSSLWLVLDPAARIADFAGTTLYEGDVFALTAQVANEDVEAIAASLPPELEPVPVCAPSACSSACGGRRRPGNRRQKSGSR
jgi:hypothetical protein